jgi:hypothetical protein
LLRFEGVAEFGLGGVELGGGGHGCCGGREWWWCGEGIGESCEMVGWMVVVLAEEGGGGFGG